jgi:hypothetical protein
MEKAVAGKKGNMNGARGHAYDEATEDVGMFGRYLV